MTHPITDIIVTLLCSIFFSGMESAFVASDKLRMELDRSDTSTISKILNVFYSHPNGFISTMLVGNIISLVALGLLMAGILDRFVLSPLHWTGNGALRLLLQILVTTLVALFARTFMPKTIFGINPNRMMAVFAIPAFIAYAALSPVAKFASMLSRGILRLVGIKVNKKATEHAFTKIDLDNLIQSSIESTPDENGITDEIKIFQNALYFSEVKVKDCMVPRTEIEAVEIASSIDNLKSRFIESGKSKIIVYKEDIDHIVGFIHSSEMFRAPTDWPRHIKEIPIVPETMSAQKLLKKFMQQKKSLAIVVDEFGGTSGLVTMEDLVEEIFGDIEDEHDNNNYVAKKISENEFVLSGRLEIEKANELLGLHLPESEEYVTVSGLILHQYQSFPKVNEVIRFGQFEFRILKSTTTKIELVRLKITG